ncbi:MAG: thioesterase family protein [Aldersonia sp.]|nr:thioesterase family protein [Aldersonia sp.]
MTAESTVAADTGLAPFRELCTLTARHDGRYDGYIDPTWTIGPKVHGGVMLAVAAAAARAKLRSIGGDGVAAMQPIAVSVDFQGAPDPGAVILAVHLRKTGRQICLADVDLIQGDRTFVRAAVTLGFLEETPPVRQVDVLTEMPVAPPEDSAVYDAESPLGKIVNVAKSCHLRVDATSAPFLSGGRGEPNLRLWARPFAGDEDDFDTAVLFAMMAADISPPVLMNLGMFGWAPTVQLTTYLQRRPAPGWLRINSSAKSVGTALFDEDHVIVDSTGAVVVQSRQLAMIPR